MKTLNCVIVDDEPIAVSILERFVAQHPYLTLLKSFTKPSEALAFLQNNAADLLLLDIHMPDINGLDLLSGLKNKPRCIFTTAYRDYALDAFDLDVLDYLKKPIRYSRFEQAVDKVMNHSENQSSKPGIDFFEFSMHRKIFRIPVNEIIYLESRRNTVHIHSVKEEYHTVSTLSALFDDLPEGFLRIHRSFIVNKIFVRSYNKSEVELSKDDIKLQIGNSYSRIVTDQLRR